MSYWEVLLLIMMVYLTPSMIILGVLLWWLPSMDEPAEEPQPRYLYTRTPAVAASQQTRWWRAVLVMPEVLWPPPGQPLFVLHSVRFNDGPGQH